MPEAFPEAGPSSQRDCIHFAVGEVTITSTFEDAQLALWKRAKNHCKRPCPDAAWLSRGVKKFCWQEMDRESLPKGNPSGLLQVMIAAALLPR